MRLNINFTLSRKFIVGFEINLQDSRDQYVVVCEGKTFKCDINVHRGLKITLFVMKGPGSKSL